MNALLLRRRSMQQKTEEKVDPYMTQPFTAVMLQNYTFQFENLGTNYTDLTSLKYNINNTGWVELDLNDPDEDTGYIYLDVSAGDRISFIGNGAWKIARHAGFGLTLDGQGYGHTKMDIEGNLMSLFAGDNFINCTVIPYACFYNGLFNSGQNHNYLIRDITNLRIPAVTIEDYGLCSFFKNIWTVCGDARNLFPYLQTVRQYGCADLFNQYYTGSEGTLTISLPATTVGTCGYLRMFRNYSAIKVAPELPGVNLGTQSYSQMFYGCAELTTPPSILPATSLAERCYQGMFYGCTKLRTAPILPAITLIDSCYQLMFQGCSRLNYIKAMFTTTPSSSYTSNWVQGVAASGTFIKNSAAEWSVTGTSGIPEGWTVQTASS